MTRLQQVRRRLIAVLSALLIVISSGLCALPGAQADPLDNLGVRGFSTCVGSTKHGSVALLMDASGSLQFTDPNNNRVPAAQLLVTRLAEMASGLSATIDARAWTFSVTASPLGSWRDLSGNGAANLNNDVAQLASANTGFDTDYWTALTTVSQDLREHARDEAPPEAEACSLLVILSDGEFDIDVRTTKRQQDDYGMTKPIPGAETIPLDTQAGAAQAEQAAISDLCRDGGVADAMRADKMYIVGVGLSSRDAPDFSLLRSIVEGPVNGSGAAATCGSLQPRGKFVEADDIESLLLAFDPDDATGSSTMPTDSDGTSLDEVAACPADAGPCPEGIRTFVLDQTLTSLTILSIFSSPGIELNVLPPQVPDQPEPEWIAIGSGQATGNLTVGDVPMSYNWYDPSKISAVSVTLDGKTPHATWSGPWQIYFRDTTGAAGQNPGRVKVSFRSDISLRLAASSSKEFVLQNTSDVGFTLARSDGTVIAGLDPAPRAISISARLEQSNGASEQVMSAEGEEALAIVTGKTVPWTVPDSFQVGKATLVTSVSLVTAGGIQLEPLDINEPVSVLAPYPLPTIVTSEVDFGTVRATVPATATIEIKGPGCVWIDTATAGFATYTVIPKGLDPSHLTYTTDAGSSAGCLSIGPGQTRKLSITMTSATPASGELRGQLTIHLVPEESKRDEVVTSLPLRGSFEPDPNTLVFTSVLVICLLIGLGMPILALWWSRRRAARFPERLTSIEVAALNAVYSQGTIQVLSTPSWSLPGEVTHGRRRTRITADIHLEAKAGIRLNEPGYAKVVAEGKVGVGSQSPYSTRSGAPVIGLGLANEWAFLADAASFTSGPVTGQLIVFQPAARPDVDRGTEIDKAAREAGERMESLYSRLGGLPAASTPKVRADKGAPPPQPPAAPDDVWGMGDTISRGDIDNIWLQDTDQSGDGR